MKKEVLVVNYHQVAPRKNAKAQAADNLFSVTADAFHAQIDCLLKNNVKIVSLNDIVNNTIPDGFSIAVTVDDGNDSDYEIVYPRLKAEQIKAAFFWLAGKELPCGVNKDQINEMLANGFLIGSHGIHHHELPLLNYDRKKNELEFSKKKLEEKTGSTVSYFAFPFGMYDAGLIVLAQQAGYKAACTTDVKLNDPNGQPFLLHRWSVKQSTTLKEFEEMVTNQNILKRKIKTSKIKRAMKQLIGRKIADRVNFLFHS